MVKVDTIDLKGQDYATVPQRLKQFRQDNPRSVVDTDPTFNDDGSVTFKAHIVKDKKDENTAEATGHSHGKLGESKAFEKLETVAVGRALALLGYLNNGQIATTEEMVEFEEYQETKWQEIVEEIANAKDRKEFTAILAKLTPEQKREATPLINERIEELKKDAESKPSTTAK